MTVADSKRVVESKKPIEVILSISCSYNTEKRGNNLNKEKTKNDEFCKTGMALKTNCPVPTLSI